MGGATGSWVTEENHPTGAIDGSCTAKFLSKGFEGKSPNLNVNPEVKIVQSDDVSQLGTTADFSAAEKDFKHLTPEDLEGAVQENKPPAGGAVATPKQTEDGRGQEIGSPAKQNPQSLSSAAAATNTGKYGVAAAAAGKAAKGGGGGGSSGGDFLKEALPALGDLTNGEISQIVGALGGMPSGISLQQEASPFDPSNPYKPTNTGSGTGTGGGTGPSGGPGGDSGPGSGNVPDNFNEFFEGDPKSQAEAVARGVLTMQALIQRGLSTEAAAVVAGNFQKESRFNSGVVNSIGATGLAQWLGQRRANMKAFVGADWAHDALGQIDFFMNEISQTQGPLGQGSEARTGRLLATTTDLRELNRIMSQYERYGGVQGDRVDLAQRILNAYQSGLTGQGSAATGGPGTGGGFNSQSPTDVSAAQDYLRQNSSIGDSKRIMNNYGYDPVGEMNPQFAVQTANTFRQYNEWASQHGYPQAQLMSATRYPLAGMPGGMRNRANSNHAIGMAFDNTLGRGSSAQAVFARFAANNGLYHGRVIYGNMVEDNHYQGTSARINGIGNAGFDSQGRPLDVDALHEHGNNMPGVRHLAGQTPEG